MSRQNHIATFERKNSPLDHFVSEAPAWDFVARAGVELEPLGATTQRTEFVDGNQVKSTRRTIVRTTWTPTLANVDSACRMKVAKPVAVNNDNLEADENFRIFGIEQIVNVGERNRVVEMMVAEVV